MRTALSFLATFFLAVPTLAANGDPCTATEIQALKGGNFFPVWCYRILDTTNSASGGPIEFNIPTQVVVKPGQPGPTPDALSVRLSFNDCSGGVVPITTREVSNGTQDGFAGNPSPSLNLAAGGTSRINVPIGEPYGTILTTSWSGVTGCTAGFRVQAIGWGFKR